MGRIKARGGALRASSPLTPVQSPPSGVRALPLSTASLSDDAPRIARAPRYPVSTLRAASQRSAIADFTGSLLGRAQFAQLAGLSFQTPTGAYRRDSNDALGYKPDLTLDDYWQRYKRGGIAKRIVEAYPKATWSGEMWLQEIEDADRETEFERAARELLQRLHASARIRRADILAGIGEYAVLLIGAPGPLSSPLRRVSSPDQIAYLQPISQRRAKIKELVTSPIDPRYGQVATYEITFARERPPELVHWSRVVHIADGVLEDEIFGTPRLEAVWNHLDDLVKVVGGGAEAAWNRMDPGMQLDVDPEIEFDEEEEDDLDEQLDQYRHGLDRTLRTRGTKINMLAANVFAFGSNATSILEQISGTSAIPLRILLGTERGQLASTQDRDNWSDRVTERRGVEGVAVIQQLADRLIACGALPEPVEPNYRPVWSEIEELNSQAKAAVAMSLSQANAASFNVEQKPILTVDEIRSQVFNLEPLTFTPPEPPDTPDNPNLEPELEDAPPEDDPGNDPNADPEDDAPTDAERAAYTAVSEPPGDPDWRVVHRVGDAYLVAAERSWRRLWREARNLVEDRAYQLDYLLSQRSAEGAARVVDNALAEAEDRHRERIERHIVAITRDAGKAAASNANSRKSFFETLPEDDPRVAAPDNAETVVAFDILFDATDAASVAFARGYAYDLIVQTSPETRAAIRDIIVRGLEDGMAPRALRNEITQVIGLRTDQIRALENFIARGASRAQAERYARKLLRDRAILIARTECLPGDAAVDAAEIKSVHRRWYVGDLVEIETSSGRKFTATPNHPMLTGRGWVPASAVQDSDYLIRDTRQEQAGAAGDQNVETSPTTIGEVFDAASAVGVVEREATRQPDFHGDGLDGYVDIASPFRSLLLGRLSPILEPSSNPLFVSSDRSRLPQCGACGRLLEINQRTCRCNTSFGDSVFSENSLDNAASNLERLGNPIERIAALVQINGLGSVDVAAEVRRLSAPGEEGLSRLLQAAASDTGLNEYLPDPLRVGPYRSGDGVDTPASLVEADRVVAVTVRSFAGHVFNLSTADGYFTANGGYYTGNTIRAANEGQRQLWQQAANLGILSINQKRKWITTLDGRERDAHHDMHGQIVGINERFVKPGGKRIEPGEEPNCRCASGLATPAEVRKYEREQARKRKKEGGDV